MKNLIEIFMICAFAFIGYQIGYSEGLKDGDVSIEQQTENFIEGVLPIGLKCDDFSVREQSPLYWVASGSGIVKDGNTAQQAAWVWMDSLYSRSVEKIEGGLKEILTEAEASQ